MAVVWVPPHPPIHLFRINLGSTPFNNQIGLKVAPVCEDEAL